MTPFEAGLGPFVNMEKGDFVGRAALVGKDQRSLLHGVTCQRGTPQQAALSSTAKRRLVTSPQECRPQRLDAVSATGDLMPRAIGLGGRLRWKC